MRLTRTGAAVRHAQAAAAARAANAGGESMSVALHRAGFAGSVKSAQQLIVTLRKKGHTIPSGFRKPKRAPLPAPTSAAQLPAIRPPRRAAPTSSMIGNRVHVLACTEDGCEAEFALERVFDLRSHTRTEHGRFPTIEERTPVILART